MRHDHVIRVPVGSVKLGASKRECCLDHNQEGFMLDAEQRLKREFQGQDMRVMQFEMHREVARDLVELTVSKMDIYLIGFTLQLSFCITLFTKGRSDVDCRSRGSCGSEAPLSLEGSRTSR